MPCVEEVEEGSRRLAYKVRAALVGLLDVSDAIRKGRNRAYSCAVCCNERAYTLEGFIMITLYDLQFDLFDCSLILKLELLAWIRLCH